MAVIETRTTHTVKISWKHRAVFDKRDLVNRINGTMPDGAIITGLTVSDTPTVERDTTTPTLVRTLAITYVTDSRDLYRRP